jgi:thymidine phosphorylase
MPDEKSAIWMPQELLRRKRMGQALTPDQIGQLVSGISDGRLGDAQVGAFAMAVCALGMNAEEITALTLAMRDSGTVLDWHGQGFDRPILDKHSTGGVGDLVSLMLGPMLAACGAFVPMLSGRGLGHTGGTLDKLESIPGYQTQISVDRLRQVVRETGVAIVGAGADLAPADRRLYSIRDITGTVESIALITASILSKKLAAGTDALILDIKTGNGASMPSLEQARSLALSLVQAANLAGLPTRALISDMSQPLAPAVGNALELQCTLSYLRGEARPARLHQLTLHLGAELLCQGGLALNPADALAQLQRSLDQGTAAEHFARMVKALGGPGDLLERADAYLPAATWMVPVYAPDQGFVSTIDTRALGLAVVALGGGRTRPDQRIDHRVGLSAVAELGSAIDSGTPLAIVHASDEASLAQALLAVRAAFTVTATSGDLPATIRESIVFNASAGDACAVPC